MQKKITLFEKNPQNAGGKANPICFSLCLLMLCCIIGCIPNAIACTVTPNYQTYNYAIYANQDNGDLTVPSGYTLTINQANARFGTITVEPSAELIIVNTTIKMREKIIVKSDCEDPIPSNWADPFAAYMPTGGQKLCMGGQLTVINSTITVDPSGNRRRWTGIEVWGRDNTAPLSVTYKGRAYFTKSTITKAEFAVVTARDPWGLADKSGGVIRASETNFIDNVESIIYSGTPSLPACNIYIPGNPPMYMAEVNLNGLEYFVRCKFDYTSNYDQPTVAKGHIDLSYNCKDIRILGCTFDDHRLTKYRDCYGIVADYTADFTVDNKYIVESLFGKKTMTAPSTFNNLWYGVLVYGMTNLNRASIMNSAFTNCTNSIDIDGTFKTIITGNTINVPQFQTTSDASYGNSLGNGLFGNLGIQLRGCTGYTVENNTIASQSNYSNTRTWGIYVHSSGPQANAINNNNTSNCNYNYYAIANNYNYMVPASNPIGLRFTCNINAGSSNNDFTVMSGGNYSGISGLQTMGQNSNGSYRSAGNTFATKPQNSTYYNFYNQTGCLPVRYVGYGNGSAMPAKKYNVTNLSGTAAPCRSFGLLFPMVAHWESKIADLESVIASMSNSGTLDSAEEQTLQNHYDEYGFLVDSVLNHYIFEDTVSLHYDSVAYALEHFNLNYDYKLWLAGAYQSMYRYDDAITLLEGLNEAYGLSDIDADKVNYLTDMYRILKTLHDNGQRWNDLTDEEKETVQMVYDNDDYMARSIAAALLHHFTGLMTQNPLLEPGEEGTISGRPGKLLPLPELSMYPVPARKILMVRWMPKGNESKAIMQITDMLGKTLIKASLEPGEQQIDISQLTAGIYFSSVKTTTGKLIAQQKLVKE